MMERDKDFIKFMLHTAYYGLWSKKTYWGNFKVYFQIGLTGGKKVQTLISVQVVYSEV